MDTKRMLQKCVDGQWKPEDLDFTGTPRRMTQDEEMAVVQYFTDMAEIERFAGALFAEQRRIVSDPTLQKIFATFMVDEERHAQVAERLARFYDVHHYRVYAPSPGLTKFKPHFLNAVQYLSAEIANTYITTGEMMLDVALLRSLDDYVNDDMSARAMELINRDESRHIAVDYYMTEFYASPEYQARRDRAAKRPLRKHIRAWMAFAGVLWHSGPFAQQVFFGPMQRTDPTGKRLTEAVKRLQLLSNRPNVAARPFTRFMQGLRGVVNHPFLGPIAGRLAQRLTANFPLHLYQELFSNEELQHANTLSIDALADEALAAKSAA
jgi:hypothetical protein